MWVLSLIYNETTSYRALRLDSTTRIGRHHDYKNDPNCVYIADLKVPKTYITISVGQQNAVIDGASKLTVTFQSICTTDVNGKIFKLPSRDSDSFAEDFTEYTDLTLKVNANKSDRIKLRLRWIPVIVLPFSKKIQYEGIVQQSPLPRIISELLAAKIDMKSTDDPFNATHYVTLTDSPDYNLQIAISRAIPVVLREWCDFLATSLDDLDSWLFTTRPDLAIQNIQGHTVLPNIARRSLFKGKSALILADNINSRQVRRFESWLKCLSASDVFIKSAPKFLEAPSTTVAEIPTLDIYCFRILEENFKATNDILDSTNLSEDLWNAVIAADISLLRKPARDFFKGGSVEKRQQQDPIPSSQRRKRRKLERLEDTNFFSFTPVPSSLPKPDIIPNSGVESHSPDGAEASPSPSLPQAVEIEGNIPIDANQMDGQHDSFSMLGSEHNEPDAQSNIDGEKHDQIKTVTPQLKDSVYEEAIPKQKLKRIIVPEVSLADAVKSTKQLADDYIKQELSIREDIEPEMKSLLVIQDMVLEGPKRAVRESQHNYQGRKNFKAFRKHGPKQNSITRTYIELVDNGNAVSFKDSFSPAPAEVNNQIEGDFSAEMQNVRGFQPEASQLFVNDASDSEMESDGANFQFSSTRDSRASRNNLHDIDDNEHGAGQMSEDEDEEDDEDGVRFTFSRRA